MTIRDYLDPARWPLSTTGAGICGQMASDTFRHDDFEGNPPAPGTPEAAKFEELKAKIAAWNDPELDAEMNAYARSRGVSAGWGVMTGAKSGQ